jgi:CRP-like cAMP-binding protein
MIIADFGPGEILGEIALLDGRGRSADASAVRTCELIVLERRRLLPFLMDRPALCIDLLVLLCGKLRLADDRSIDYAFLNLRGRLAKVLLEKAVPVRELAPEGRLGLTQGELAAMVGVSRENVNRQLKEWQRQHLIALSQGWITLHDRPRLQRLVDREGG